MSRANPLIQALSLIVAAVFLGLAFVIGAVVVGALLAVGAVAAIAIAIRIWWLQRKIRRTATGSPSGQSARHAIEGEYTVVGQSDTRANRPHSLGREDAQSGPRNGSD